MAIILFLALVLYVGAINHCTNDTGGESIPDRLRHVDPLLAPILVCLCTFVTIAWPFTCATPSAIYRNGRVPPNGIDPIFASNHGRHHLCQDDVDFEDTLVPHLERCIYEGTLNIVRYGFTPLGYKKIEENGKGQRIVPYIPRKFVIVRLQPWGEYLCQSLDLDLDLDGGGPTELYFFRTLTDEERPNSDLAMLLPLYKKLQLARQVHHRALILASRP